jgi:hypothetical protein
VPKFLHIDIGCAECREEEHPIGTVVGVFDSVDDAKKAGAKGFNGELQWLTHPDDGFYVGHGGGDIWILPLTKYMSDLQAALQSTATALKDMCDGHSVRNVDECLLGAVRLLEDSEFPFRA